MLSLGGDSCPCHLILYSRSWSGAGSILTPWGCQEAQANGPVYSVSVHQKDASWKSISAGPAPSQSLGFLKFKELDQQVTAQLGSLWVRAQFLWFKPTKGLVNHGSTLVHRNDGAGNVDG